MPRFYACVTGVDTYNLSPHISPARCSLRIVVFGLIFLCMHTGLMYIRLGVEHLDSCAVTPSGGAGENFVSTAIGAGEQGQTMKVFLLGAFNPDWQQCVLRLSPRQTQVNHANVQAQRLLLTLAVQ